MAVVTGLLLLGLSANFLVGPHVAQGQSIGHRKEKFLIAKSLGTPINLQCVSTKSTRIQVSGVTLFRGQQSMPANDRFPNIDRISQKDCEKTIKFAKNDTRRAECTLELEGLQISSDEMLVVVFICSHGYGADNQIHEESSGEGDVTLQCSPSDIIGILAITFNGEPPQDVRELKESCIKEMVIGKLPKEGDDPQKVYPAKCVIRRNGKEGKLVVKYKCLIPPEDSKRTVSKRSYPDFSHATHESMPGNGIL